MRNGRCFEGELGARDAVRVEVVEQRVEAKRDDQPGADDTEQRDDDGPCRGFVKPVFISCCLFFCGG